MVEDSVTEVWREIKAVEMKVRAMIGLVSRVIVVRLMVTLKMMRSLYFAGFVESKEE